MLMKQKAIWKLRAPDGFLFRSVAGLVLALAGFSVFACSVPVFRYALERWKPDSYGVVVFHRGEMSNDQKALVTSIDANAMRDGEFVNTSVHLADLDTEIDPSILDLWKSQKTDELPWMVVLTPRSSAATGTVWSSKLNEESVGKLVDSPVRREIARKLLTGTTSVWVLLEIGDSKKDDAAEKRLKSRLSYLEKELKIQELDPQDIADGLVSVEPDTLRVSFSTIRLSRTDPAEDVFVRMLLESEDDLRDFDEPIVFPIFGQGRSLYALIGDGINDETIDETAVFLVGPCSCQVKEQNPGMDLVFSVDWENLVDSAVSNVEKELPPLIGLANIQADLQSNGSPDSEAGFQATKVNAEGKGISEPTDGESHTNPIIRNSVVVVLAMFMMVFGGSFFFFRR